MRIVIDLQGAQNFSRDRGIGRYTLSLGIALAKERGNHDIKILLNGAFPASITSIENKFSGIISKNNFIIFNPLTPSQYFDSSNHLRLKSNERLYEEFVKKLNPDALLICSHIDGYFDNTVSSIDQNNYYTTASVLYDLIPLSEISENPSYMGPRWQAWYFEKISALRRADLLLSISEYSKSQAISRLNIQPQRIAGISAATSEIFKPWQRNDFEERSFLMKYGISCPFILTAAKLDPRKNPIALIHAFALLPEKIQRSHQIIFIGEIETTHHEELIQAANHAGLNVNHLVFTGYVDDADLVKLYSCCTAFVFPTLHEGFGLPALEAMACGAPTIASGVTSLPEVIGLEEALFDPRDPQDIKRLLMRVLDDATFRERLRRHGSEQSRKFSWESTAQRAFAALENAFRERQKNAVLNAHPLPTAFRPRLAFVSPLLSDTGHPAIREAAEVLAELSVHYTIDVIAEQEQPPIGQSAFGGVEIRSVPWFVRHARLYDRVLYHVANDDAYSYVIPLIHSIPGTVVLHDFFLGEMLWRAEQSGRAPGSWSNAITRGHGWAALQGSLEAIDAGKARQTYPCNFGALQQALGVIVHSDAALRLGYQWYGPTFAQTWRSIPLPRMQTADLPQRRRNARATLSLNDSDFLVCAFGLPDQGWPNQLIEAWTQSSLGRDVHCKLVFVGAVQSGEAGQSLRQALQAPALKGCVSIAALADEAAYQRHLAAADMAVQLRPLSDGHALSATLDCMNYSLPIIICQTSADAAALPSNAAIVLPDRFGAAELTRALDQLHAQPSLRMALSEQASAHIRTCHQPRACAVQYREAIEVFHGHEVQGKLGLIKRFQSLGLPNDPADLATLAEVIATIHPPMRSQSRQLLVDVSELAQRDSKSGIQRVVRSVLHVLLQNPPHGFRVEPVYATPEHGYRYARCFTARFLGLGDLPLDDDPIFAMPGDVFWGLDLRHDIVLRQQQLNTLRLRGIKVVFTIYDLLPLTLPEVFWLGAGNGHGLWLRTLLHVADGLLCISQSVATEVSRYARAFGLPDGHPIQIGWAHLGSEIVELTGKPAFHPTPAQTTQIAAIARFPAFLMVGTLEPRKAHAQALAAFELLWSRGEQVSLVIVGKQGWLVDELMQRLRSHPLRERHLFWLEAISDGMLEQVYGASTCLIAASLDEGYGLPLVEAARHGLPILARDIPVFREVAGSYASYFSGLAPRVLALAVTHWLELHEKGQATQSAAMPWLPWKQATQQMLDVILNDHWQDLWKPVKEEGLVARYWGSDYRLQSQVGNRVGTAMVSTGIAGYMLYGPYLDLASGLYVVTLKGALGFGGASGAHVDVCSEGGQIVLAEQTLGVLADLPTDTLATLRFKLDKDCKGLEVRMHVTETSDLSLASLELYKIGCEDGANLATATATATTPAAARAARSPRNARRLQAYWATHPRLQTQVGHAVSRSIYTTGKAGFLIFGPYISLPAGYYAVRLLGEIFVQEGIADTYVDIACQKGVNIFCHQALSMAYSAAEGMLCEIVFEIQTYVEDIEVRVFVGNTTDMRLDAIQIEEVDVAHASAAHKNKVSDAMCKNRQMMPLAKQVANSDDTPGENCNSLIYQEK